MLREVLCLECKKELAKQRGVGTAKLVCGVSAGRTGALSRGQRGFADTILQTCKGLRFCHDCRELSQNFNDCYDVCRFAF